MAGSPAHFLWSGGAAMKRSGVAHGVHETSGSDRRRVNEAPGLLAKEQG